MKLTKRKIRFLAMLLLSALTLTSCSTSAEEVSSDADAERLWDAEVYNIDDIDDERSGLTLCGEYIYYCKSGQKFNSYIDAETGEVEYGPSKYYRLKIGKDEVPEEIKLGGYAEKYVYGAIIQPDDEGNLFLYFGTGALAKYDELGNELYFVNYSDNIDGNPSSFITDSEGRLYGWNIDNVYFFNSDCTYKGTLNCKDGCNGLIKLGDKIYYRSLFYNKIYELSFETASSVNEISTEPLYNSIAAYSDTSIIGTLDGKIYSLNLESGKIEKLMQTENYGISGNSYTLSCTDDGRIIVYCHEIGDIAIMSETSSVDKQIITIGTFSPSTALRNHVSEFNKTSDDYQIVIKQYYDVLMDNTIDGSGRQDAITKFHLDIASGNCPDILNLSFDEVSTYVSKDLFEDLTSYYEASGIKIMDNIAEAYTFDGVLAAIPISVQLRTIVGRSEDIDGLTGWTLEEMMDCLEGCGSETINADSSLMLKYCLKLNQSRFVDWENYTCDFENESFYKLLEFCSGFDGSPGYASMPISNIADFDSELYEVNLVTPSDYLVLQQFLESENITFIGFPTDDGSGTIVEEKDGAYSISSVSKYKDVAWQFIESFLNEVPEYAIKKLSNGYPVSNETREQYFSDAMSEPWVKVTDYDTWETTIERRNVAEFTRKDRTVNYYAPFEEELAPIVDLLENAEVAVTNDSTILDIILENSEEYFSGEKSAEEAAKQIQSRVKIYLNERK